MTLIYHNAEQPEQNWSVCDVKHITSPKKKIVHSEYQKRKQTFYKMYHFCTTTSQFEFLLFGFDHLR